MHLPSVEQLVDQAASVARRFPVELAVAICGTLVSLQLTQKSLSDSSEWFLLKMLLLCLLALPSFLAVKVSSDYRSLSARRRWLLYTLVAAAITLFYFTIPGGAITEKTIIRFLMLNVAAHLFVACAGFLGRGSTLAFWQYNRTLFLRIITSGIFSGVLLLGLVGALAALNELFNLRLNEAWYARIFIIIAGLFNTIFFLHGVPKSAEALEHDSAYPQVLSIFTRFVLLPLVFIYFAILLAYELRIAMQWKLPTGWVSNLIIAFAIAGLLSTLLVYPIRNAENNKWVKVFAKWFYLLMLPLIVLMFVAIITRISDYGFTEERLIVLITACWLTIITIYFIVKPEGDIRIIPFSLAVLAIASQLSIFGISRHSQQKRLKNVLAKNGLLRDGKAQVLTDSGQLSIDDAENIESITRYLVKMHGVNSVAPFMRKRTEQSELREDYAATRRIVDSLGYSKAINTNHARRIYSATARNEAINIAGYSEFVPVSFEYDEEIKTTQAWLSDGKITVDWSKQGKQVIIPIDSLTTNLIERKDKYVDYEQLSPEELRFSYTADGNEFIIQFLDFYAEWNNDTWQLARSRGFVLIK